MGCSHSKKKTKVKQGEKGAKKAQDGGDGKGPSDELPLGVQEQLERSEWQLKVLQMLAASGSRERAELLRMESSAHGELCGLVQSVCDKVKTETITELNLLYEEKSKSISEDHQKKMEELQRIHCEENTVLTETYLAAQNVLKVKVEELTTELQVYNELKRRLEESTFKKDLQRNIQAHGSPGAFWESEQESLLFVIEMKTERVQEQGNKLLQMEALVERNLSLEDQLIHALQQNEDLRVRINNYQSVIQQLSGEQRQQQAALERLSQLSQRLGQEKDQLLFKLKEQDSRAPLHLPAILPEIAPR